MRTTFLFLLFFITFGTAGDILASQPLHHQIEIELHPDTSRLQSVDRVTLVSPSNKSRDIVFFLNGNLKISSLGLPSDISYSISPKEDEPSIQLIHIQNNSQNHWPDPLSIVFHYAGHYATESDNQNPEIFLSGSSNFYPQLNTNEPDLMTFEMTTTLPTGWSSVSQGEKYPEPVADTRTRTLWRNTHPNNEIFLIANHYHEYEDRSGNVSLQAYLLQDDPALAQRYLTATKKYLAMFSKLLGDYPYPKFALIETPGPAGYGMPSFTYLGSRVIRLPFILETSYPHEILHNWWGNGVFYDPRSTNWSEGLTSYLADHYLQAIKGKGPQYRFQELMKYDSYVNAENDFPIDQFRFAQSQAEQAVGYGKTLMTLHMLRLQLGDAPFLEGLRRFYKQNRFQYADLKAMRNTFESVSHTDLKYFFEQWTQQTGAPQIELSFAEFNPAGEGFELNLTLTQKNSKPYSLQVPVAVWEEGKKQPLFLHLNVKDANQSFRIELQAKPTAVLIDPYTDLFRKLNEGEIPPSIGQTYGAQQQTVWLSSEEDTLNSAYKNLAVGLMGDSEMLTGGKPSTLPEGSLWLLGKNHSLNEKLKSNLNERGFKFDAMGVTIEGKHYPWAKHSFVFTLPRFDGQKGTLSWIVAGTEKSVPGLIRKLPHYSKYGYLAFKGDAPDNQVKGQWQATPSGREKIFTPGQHILPPQKPLNAERVE
jgi:aminopeptidase N